MKIPSNQRIPTPKAPAVGQISVSKKRRQMDLDSKKTWESSSICRSCVSRGRSWRDDLGTIGTNHQKWCPGACSLTIVMKNPYHHLVALVTGGDTVRGRIAFWIVWYDMIWFDMKYIYIYIRIYIYIMLYTLHSKRWQACPLHKVILFANPKWLA